MTACAQSMLDRSPMTVTIRGGSDLSGEVEVFGSKKLVPKVMAASLLTDEPCDLGCISWIEDVAVASVLLSGFGRRIEKTGPRRIRVSGKCSPSSSSKRQFERAARKSRVPILTAGPQLARLGEARIPPLGGDLIGRRGIEVHISLLQGFGADVMVRDGWIYATAARLRGTVFELPFPMVGVTEHALLAAVLAVGRTEIHNAAVDPEIQELTAVLRKMGARIAIDSSRRTVVIDGVPELDGFQHSAGRDRIEAGSWASLALACGGDVLVRGVDAREMRAFLYPYRASGGEARASSDGIRFTGSSRRHPCIRLESGPYPAFETDWHPPLLAALTQTRGSASVHETLFEGRFTTVPALRKMKAKIKLSAACGWTHPPCRFGLEQRQHTAIVRGPTQLRAIRANIPDLRGGFALLAAALTCPDESILSGAELMQRGYEDLPARLRLLGGKISVAA